MRVVIADDMSPPRNFAKRVLRDAGYDVVGEARDGLEAIQLCKTLKPDMVLLDTRCRFSRATWLRKNSWASFGTSSAPRV
jgi:AmiR/NasT family two-component response regulator